MTLGLVILTNKEIRPTSKKKSQGLESSVN